MIKISLNGLHVPAGIVLALILLWWGFSAFDQGESGRSELVPVPIPLSESLMPETAPRELMVRQYMAELYETRRETLASAPNPLPPPTREDELNRAGDGLENELLYVNQDFARAAGLEANRLEFTRAVNTAVEALKDESTIRPSSQDRSVR